ncbi:MAG: sigma 54-interacting transcriptional regulator [Acidobacteria bacterium]|nr:sigma 54-interacting transcriptional regulator [Acidobacteriota bacterium]MBA3884620.1 sigma 54-interacting transcriptional regulator [Acidobacteriota bacterium]
MQIVADRFIHVQGAWFDLASGASVRLHVSAAGSRGAQIAWAARCAVHANLRHPLLNPLVDFGALGAEQCFEAYENRGAVPAGGRSGEAWLMHAIRFCRAHGVGLEQPLADLAVRAIGAGPSAGIPIGIVLQRRAALDAVQDALAATSPAGACRVTLAGARQSGLRTIAVLAARAARLGGYVPVAASALDRWPGLAKLLADRHVCVIEWEEGPRQSLAPFLSRLAAGVGRRHVVLSLVRQAPGGEPAVALDPLSVRALTAMIFIDPEHPPSPMQVMQAARAAEGRPGAMLERLDNVRAVVTRPRAESVRETAPAFAADGRVERSPMTRPRRTAAVLLAAARRADRLAERGRHVQAERTLRRALRVLEVRGLHSQAAECALALGRLARERGRADAAVSAFERARDLAPDGLVSVRATVELGRTWLYAARLTEAEAAFRTAHLAATGMREPYIGEEAAAGLAECLCLQDRADEAAALPPFRQPGGDRQESVHLALGRVLIALARGDLPVAVGSARAAMDRAAALRDPRVVTRAHRMLGLALAAAGDQQQAGLHLDDGVALARAAHLPVEALRLRCVRLTLSDTPSRSRLARHLRAAAGGAVPRLVQMEIQAACALAAGDDIDAGTRGLLEAQGIRGPLFGRPAHNAVMILEQFLERCRVAPDDKSAVEHLCAELGGRLRAVTVIIVAGTPDARLLAVWGRAWPGEHHAPNRALATGLSLSPDPAVEPCVAAEPLRYGGEVIAALACRWAPGVALEPARASSLLRVAGLAVAANVRAMLDRAIGDVGGAATGDLLGESGPARTLRESVARAARAPFPVLIEGESGSGKELVARAVHRLSPRRDRRFCPLNCAALTDDLIEAELFGHARGAFTGAVGERAGLFEEADGGTLFLDEIGELSARAQAKLLRVLQDGEVRRVGENHARRVDVRIVAATNRRLEQETAAGRFRADLRFRLDVVRLDVPPLRERPGDVSLLAAHFWTDATARVGSRATLSPEALAALARYDWPGNVRELQNVVAWMAVHSPTRGRVGPSGLPAHVAHAGACSGGTFEAARLEFERRFVRAALATANGQRTATAAALGVSRQGLAKMLRRLGLE